MIYTNKLMKIIAFAIFAIFISSINISDLFAEQTTGVIRGSVIDESGILFLGHLFKLFILHQEVSHPHLQVIQVHSFQEA